MRRLRLCGLVALAGLLSACQAQQQPPQEELRDVAYVDFVLEMMVEAARLSEGTTDAAPAIQAVEIWRGAGDDEGAD